MENKLEAIIKLIMQDKMIPNDDDWTEAYFSGIIDTYLYLKENKEMNWYPWNLLPWEQQPTLSEVLKNG